MLSHAVDAITFLRQHQLRFSRILLNPNHFDRVYRPEIFTDPTLSTCVGKLSTRRSLWNMRALDQRHVSSCQSQSVVQMSKERTYLVSGILPGNEYSSSLDRNRNDDVIGLASRLCGWRCSQSVVGQDPLRSGSKCYRWKASTLR